jgi:uncharacterized repeat protein (TIGR03847 family)
VLDEVLRRTGGAGAPAVAPAALDDKAPLDQPIEEDFRVGTLALAWDGESGVLVIEAHQMALADDDDEQDEPDDDAPAASALEGDGEVGDVLRVRLSPAVARAFAQRAGAVVGAGRPPCPFCGLPLDPSGHICPRQNGYRRR